MSSSDSSSVAGSLESRRDGEARTTSYRHGEFERGLRLEVQKPGSEPEYANGLLSFRIRLEPKGAGTPVCCASEVEIEEAASASPAPRPPSEKS
jgi:hypothetical protein